jgi:outer membrane protein assembly factor BamB
MQRRRITLLAAGLVVLFTLVGAGTSRAAGTVLAGDTVIEAQHDSNSAGRAEAFRTTASTSGTAQTITVYVDAADAATKIIAGLYSNSSSGHPGTLLGEGTLTAPVKAAWNDIPIGGVAVSSGAVYWIALLSPSGGGTVAFRDAAGGSSETSSQQTLGDLTATWTTGVHYSDGPLSAYVSGGTAATPTLQLSTNALSFTTPAGAVDPAPSSVAVSNAGAGTLSFTAASDASWLTVSPASGTAPASLAISASSAGLTPATYTGHVTVTSAGSAGSPATVTVTFVVTPQSAPSAADWTQVDRDSARTGDATTETTISAATASSLAPQWARQLDGKVTAQPLFLKNAYVAGATRDVVIGATNAGSIYALDASTGAVLWRRALGSSGSNCAIPGGFGVTGAPVVDKANGRIYAVSDDGKLYSLALLDGTDAAAPLSLMSDSATNKVWGGLNLHGRDLYVATASDGCDTPPWKGRVFHIDVGGSAPRLLLEWDVIAGPPNGGGGIWGYGGVAVAPDGTVYAATAADSNEQYTLYGNRMVALTGALSVLGSYGPPEPNSFPCSGAPCDLDFGASPVTFQPSGCPSLVAAGNKNGNLYLFRTADLAASGAPLQALTLNGANDSLGNGGVGGVPAYWAAGNMVFVTDAGAGTGGVAAGAVGLTVRPDCTLAVAWSAAQGGNGSPNSTPTVANGVVFVGTGSTGSVVAYNARTGAVLWSSPALGATFAAPSVGDGRLFVGSWDGFNSNSLGTIRAYAPAPPDSTPPTAAVTSPTGGSTVSGTVTLAASASDNVGVAGVQFAVDGINVGAEDTTAPYSVQWDTTTATAGSHTITATARDAAGNRTTSAGVQVTVDNSTTPPPPHLLLGDQTIEPQADSNTAGKAEAFQVQATASGTLSHLTIYVAPSNAATSLVVGLYADASGKPAALKTQASVAVSGGGAWVDVPVPATAVTAGTTYWLAILSPTGAGTLQFRDRSGAGASETSASTTLTSLPATWSTGVRYSDGALSGYGLGS